ncbi:CoA transferase [Sphingobium sp. SCG-1]|uniref:CaiB/BaiF CoA transferase family protein n=1 Tax=Sphingobium sp. SCG-1 TaxID=2072936 RepID=UPI000CD6BB65|nr:CoA transferase [Sphingobium sp. SCG-1]AUW59677.1 CoA transferase [Sphingobium sp. SCG-1]
MGPLDSIRIVDMTSVLMGPSATQMLGDMGAEVIKVEAPDGDLMRQVVPYRTEGMGALFMNANRSKRSICLDLKKASGKAALFELIKDADILVYNVRPQAMERLGLGYEAVAACNPRLIYAGVYGFGQSGPYAAKPAYDDLIQGASGMSALIQRSGGGIPRYVPTAIADRVVGLAAVGAICASIVARDRTGLGQRVDVPMFETMVQFVLADHLAGLSYDPPLDRGGYPRQLSPERRPYQTSDGYVCALVYNDKHWKNFLSAIGMVDLPDRDPRFATFAARTANIDYVYGELARWFLSRTTAEWLDLLERADVPAMPMHDLESLLVDPHLEQVGFFQPVDHPTEGRMRSMRLPMTWSGTPTRIDRLPPVKGEHGREVLLEAGLSKDAVESMLADGSLILPETSAASADRRN